MKYRHIFLMLPLFILFPVSASHALTYEYLEKRFGGAGEKTAAYDSAVNKRELYTEVDWEKLIPPGWNPAEGFDGLDLDELDDNDPRAEKAMEQLRKMWDEAPINPDLHDKTIKISGYVASLDFIDGTELKEFLLVPYFGACIHLPPPPANQIIHVTLIKPRRGIRTMDEVTLYGKLAIEKTETDMGKSGYSMRADAVEPYVEKRKNEN